MTGFLSMALLIEARGAAAQDEARDAEGDDEPKRKEEVIRHGMGPAREVLEILADPEEKNGGDDGELTGDDEEGVAEIAALVECLHLVGSQVALFKGKQGVCHWCTPCYVSILD